MTVYVVCSGESGEGQSPVAVFTNSADAREFALGQPKCFDGEWVSIGKDIWQNGCDIVRIQKFVVQ